MFKTIEGGDEDGPYTEEVWVPEDEIDVDLDAALDEIQTESSEALHERAVRIVKTITERNAMRSTPSYPSSVDLLAQADFLLRRKDLLPETAALLVCEIYVDAGRVGRDLKAEMRRALPEERSAEWLLDFFRIANDWVLVEGALAGKEGLLPTDLDRILVMPAGALAMSALLHASGESFSKHSRLRIGGSQDPLVPPLLAPDLKAVILPSSNPCLRAGAARFALSVEERLTLLSDPSRLVRRIAASAISEDSTLERGDDDVLRLKIAQDPDPETARAAFVDRAGDLPAEILNALLDTASKFPGGDWNSTGPAFKRGAEGVVCASEMCLYIFCWAAGPDVQEKAAALLIARRHPSGLVRCCRLPRFRVQAILAALSLAVEPRLDREEFSVLKRSRPDFPIEAFEWLAGTGNAKAREWAEGALLDFDLSSLERLDSELRRESLKCAPLSDLEPWLRKDEVSGAA